MAWLVHPPARALALEPVEQPRELPDTASKRFSDAVGVFPNAEAASWLLGVVPIE